MKAVLDPAVTSRLAAGAALALAIAGAAAAAPSIAAKGVIPEGFWVLDTGKSVDLQPGSQTLWILRDDGLRLVWVSAARDEQDQVRVTSFDGVYGGEPVAVVGAPMKTKISSPGPGKFHNEGEIAGLGPYHEDCSVSEGAGTLICDGEVQTPGGARRWHDHFVYSGSGPSLEPRRLGAP